MPQTTYWPVQLNQFRDEAGRAWPPTWGIDFNSSNCAMAGSAVLVDWATWGRRKPSPPDMRKASGNRERPSKMEHVVKALRAYGVEATAHLGEPIERLTAHIGADDPEWAVLIGTNYDDVRGRWSCQLAGSFDHAIVLLGGTRKADGTVLTYDSLCGSRRWIPFDAFRRAVEVYAQEHGASAGRGTWVLAKRGKVLAPLDPGPDETVRWVRSAKGAPLRPATTRATPALARAAYGCPLLVAGRIGSVAMVDDGSQSGAWREVRGLASVRLSAPLYVEESSIAAARPDGAPRYDP